MQLFDFQNDPGPIEPDPQAEAFRQAGREKQLRAAERRVANFLFSARALGMLLAALFVLCPVLAGVVLIVMLQDFERTIPLFFGLGGGGLALYFGLQFLLAPAALRRERRWLATQPFDVRGYFDVLAPEFPREGKLRVELDFLGETPPADKLNAWLAAIGAKRMSRTSLEFLSPTIRVRTGSRGSSYTVRFYDDWQRALLRDVLTAVHRVYPLRRVIIRTDASFAATPQALP